MHCGVSNFVGRGEKTSDSSGNLKNLRTNGFHCAVKVCYCNCTKM